MPRKKNCNYILIGAKALNLSTIKHGLLKLEFQDNSIIFQYPLQWFDYHIEFR